MIARDVEIDSLLEKADWGCLSGKIRDVGMIDGKQKTKSSK